MVRKEELPETTKSTEIISKFIHDKIVEHGISYDAIATKLGRARSYAGLRIAGQKAWDFDELDILATMLGYTNAFQLVAAAHTAQQYTTNTQNIEPWMLVANQDENKQAEREEYYD